MDMETGTVVAPSADTLGSADPGMTAAELEEELTTLVGYFEEAEETGREARERSERCRDYYSNIQLTAAELSALKKRGQPPVYVNYIQRKVDTLCGIERRSRADPKAFPRNPQDEKSASAATDALRYVADQNRFDGVRSETFNDILVEGTGGADVTVAQSRAGDIKVTVKRVPWDRLWWDPHSRELDFSDAAYKGLVIWMDAKEARRDYPDAIEAIDESIRTGAGETFEDRPKYTWCDSKRKRIRIVECHYKRDGQWWVAIYTKGGFIKAPVLSPYKDKDGESVSSLHMRSGFINRENERYGHCEGLIPLQDEINKRRSKALHLLSVRQTYGNQTALTDTRKAKLELAKPDGHVELNAGATFGADFGVLPTGDMAQGQFLMLQQALGEMNATGANSALQGKDEKAQSGVALQTKIQAGATELEPQTDGLREWTHQIYEAMWMRVRQFWTGEKWVRVTDDDRNIKWVGLNKQVTLQDKLDQMQPEQAQQMGQQLMLQPGDPRLQMVVEVENDVSGLDIDLVIEEGPDMATLQSEQFEQLVNLASTPLAQGQIPFTAIIKASSLRNKDAILDEMEQAAKANAQKQEQMQQEAMQQAKAEAQANLGKTAAETEKTTAQAKQIEVDTHVSGMTALAQAGNGTLAPQPAMPVYQ
jgi:hypothetical protein